VHAVRGVSPCLVGGGDGAHGERNIEDMRRGHRREVPRVARPAAVDWPTRDASNRARSGTNARDQVRTVLQDLAKLGERPRTDSKRSRANHEAIRVVGGELEVSRKEGGLVEGQVTSCERVGVITGAKREARSGELETTYRYWLLEPGGVARRLEFDPFKVVGRFTIAEQKNGKAASEAFKALERPAG